VAFSSATFGQTVSLVFFKRTDWKSKRKENLRTSEVHAYSENPTALEQIKVRKRVVTATAGVSVVRMCIRHDGTWRRIVSYSHFLVLVLHLMESHVPEAEPAGRGGGDDEGARDVSHPCPRGASGG
jgi:hypothetical protein